MSHAYINLILFRYNSAQFDFLLDLSKKHDKLTIGIPSNYLMARLYGESRNGYDAQKIKVFFEQLKFVSDVVILPEHDFGYQKMYEKLHFDLCFYGTEYGVDFEKDKEFFKKNNVDFIPAKNISYRSDGNIDSVTLAVKNVQKTQKIILFGTGKYFDIFVSRYSRLHTITYAVDNASEKWGTKKSGIEIKNPEVLKYENPDDCLIILCAKNYSSMLEQLRIYGKFNYRSLLFNDNVSLIEEMNITIRAEDAYLEYSHEILEKLLFEFDSICKKYSLRYYIICGSLIGVLRHKGFIPWDDDIDLAMTRGDYNKLRSVCKIELKNSDYKILHYDEIGDRVFLDFMPRFIYLKDDFPTKVFDKAGSRINSLYNRKVFLDIYPLDNASDNDRKHNFIMILMRFVYVLCMGHRGAFDYSEYARLPKWKVSAIRIINSIGRLIPFRYLVRLYEYLSVYAQKEDCHNYFMSSCAITCIERKFKKEWFKEPKRMPFENIECSVPSDCDALLDGMGYKNYMTFPPLSIRKPSHYFNSDITIW